MQPSVQSLALAGVLTTCLFAAPAFALPLISEVFYDGVGSDAWLAKGQQPKPGSAILIHGDLNEPAGVKLMLEWVARQKKDSICFLPLESIAGTGRDRQGKYKAESFPHPPCRFATFLTRCRLHPVKHRAPRKH